MGRDSPCRECRQAPVSPPSSGLKSQRSERVALKRLHNALGWEAKAGSPALKCIVFNMKLIRSRSKCADIRMKSILFKLKCMNINMESTRSKWKCRDINLKRVHFMSKCVDSKVKPIHFKSKCRDFNMKWIHFMSKCIDFKVKPVHFKSK